MDAGLFIYFPRDTGHNIYFKVFDSQDIDLKKLPGPPPLPESTVRPLTCLLDMHEAVSNINLRKNLGGK